MLRRAARAWQCHAAAAVSAAAAAAACHLRSMRTRRVSAPLAASFASAAAAGNGRTRLPVANLRSRRSPTSCCTRRPVQSSARRSAELLRSARSACASSRRCLTSLAARTRCERAVSRATRRACERISFSTDASLEYRQRSRTQRAVCSASSCRVATSCAPDSMTRASTWRRQNATSSLVAATSSATSADMYCRSVDVLDSRALRDVLTAEPDTRKC